MDDILILSPVFKEKIWGGRKLESLFNYEVDSDKIGEAWLISAHRNGRSKIMNGKFKGQFLDTVYLENRELFNNLEDKEFPLLTKIIDANDVLSVQVHPDDEYAKTYANDLGKTECWYIIDAEPGANIILGHKAQTKAEFQSLIEKGKWDELLMYKDVKAGDFIYVPAGTLHAIGKGVVILETMQSSDTTYRVYDFDRIQDDGTLRELHLSESIEVTTIPHQTKPINKTCETHGKSTIETFIANEFFTVEKWDIKDNLNLSNDKFKLLNVIKGSGTINNIDINKGTGLIVTSKCEDIQLSGNIEIIVSYL